MVNKIQSKRLEIPLIIMGVLVFTSFIPLIQILILTLNGAIVSPAFALAKNDEIAIQYIYFFDSFMSVIGLILFYVSFNISWRIFSAVFTVLFLLPLVVYLLGFIKTDIYFLQNLISGIVVGLILLVVALLKKYPSN